MEDPLLAARRAAPIAHRSVSHGSHGADGAANGKVRRLDEAIHGPANLRLTGRRPARVEALTALRTLLAYIGEDPAREGLLDTPDRVLRAWEDSYGGYAVDPAAGLARTFEEVEGYDDFVLLKGIEFVSHCEHHMIPIHGSADIAYVPRSRVVGLSKLARVVDGYARRLQTQEALTAQVASAIEETLQPLGLAVLVRAQHHCMATRGVRQRKAETVTTVLRGSFLEDTRLEERFLRLVL